VRFPYCGSLTEHSPLPVEFNWQLCAPNYYILRQLLLTGDGFVIGCRQCGGVALWDVPQKDYLAVIQIPGHAAAARADGAFDFYVDTALPL